MDHLIALIRAAAANGRLKPKYVPHWEGMARGMASQQNHAGIEQLTAELEQTDRRVLSRDPAEILGIGPERFERVVKSVQVEIHVSQNAFAFQRSAEETWAGLRIVKEHGCKDLRVQAKGTAHDGFITVGNLSSKHKGGVTKALEHDLLFWEKPYRATAVSGFGGRAATTTPTTTATTTTTTKGLINIDFAAPNYPIWPEGACTDCHRFEFINRSMAVGAETALPLFGDPPGHLRHQELPASASCSYFSDDGDGAPSSFELALLEEEESRVAKQLSEHVAEAMVMRDEADRSLDDEPPVTLCLHGCGQPTYHPNSQTCNRNGTCSEMYS